MRRIKQTLFVLFGLALLYFIPKNTPLRRGGRVLAKYQTTTSDSRGATEFTKHITTAKTEELDSSRVLSLSYFSNGSLLGHCENLLKNSRNGTLEDYTRVPDITKDSDVIETLRNGCEAFRTRYRFHESKGMSLTVSAEELEFPIAYSILIHQKLHQFSLLLSAIHRTQNVYCIHVDKKSDPNFYKGAKMIAQCFNNVFLSTKRERVVYASFSRLQADINCMKDLLHIPSTIYNWTYIINLCGQDFPASTSLEIVQQLKKLNGRNMIPATRKLNEISRNRTRFVYRTRNVTRGNKIVEIDAATKENHSPPPYNITQIKNLAYNVFTRDFLQWALVDSQEGAALLNWSSFTHTPDEHYWGMLNAYPGAPGGSDFVSWWTVIRDVLWKDNKKKYVCRGYWQRDVCVFSGEELSWLMKSKKMFLNKFDVTYDVTPITCLREFLDQRTRGITTIWNQRKSPRKPPEKCEDLDPPQC